MLKRWMEDLESLEAVSQDPESRALVLRLAAMARTGTLEPFLHGLQADRGIDAETKETFTELAGDETFLLAVEDYMRRTTVAH